MANEEGETPLILADNLQRTALYYASERGYNEITEMLLMAGAEG